MNWPPPALAALPEPGPPELRFAGPSPRPAGPAPLPVEADLLALFEEVGELVLILNPAGEIIFANRALREALDYSRAELRGRTVYDVTRIADHAACQAWLTGAPAPPAAARLRLAFLAKSGKLIPAAGSAAARVDGGQVVLLQWVFRDLSLWQRAEASHREREELFHLLTLHAPVGIFRTDAAGRVTYANERWRRIAGLRHQPQPRGVWWQMVHPDDRAAVLLGWEGAQRHEREYHGEFRAQPENGTTRWVQVRLVPARLSTLLELCWVGFTEEVTERRASQAALQRANEDLEARVQQRTTDLAASNNELSQFAYVVTHDLKAPLRGIQQLSEWLSRDHASQLGPQGLHYVVMLSEKVQHLQKLVDGLLDCSRVGRTPEPETTVPMFELVQRVIRILAPPASVTVEVAEHLPVVTGNPERLQQIFRNLIDNAIKYLDKPAGRVRVDACHLDSAWQFTVADNGPGIAPRYQDRIFVFGQRLNSEKGPSGTGLGLALVKRIVEARGGRIWVDSVEGQGASMNFTWPHRAGSRIP